MNIFSNITVDLENEIFENILEKDNIRIERIISHGNISEAGFWYDQDENEWVILMKGEAEIEYKNGQKLKLNKGDYVFIPMHIKHRVSYTSPDETTVWLAIFFK